jgi:TetR/AcrR family transcriptional regulator, tetracycline repressor protein
MTSSKKQKQLLDRQVVGEAALEWIDRSGLETLSMRSLAKALNCNPMTLYRHVESREDLLKLVASLVIGKIQLPDDQLSPADWLTQLARNAREAFCLHPGAMSLIGSSQISNAMGLEVINGIVGRLNPPRSRKHRVADRLNAFLGGMVGYISLELSRPERGEKNIKASALAKFEHLEKHAPQLLNASFGMRDPSKIVHLEGGFELLIESMVTHLLATK